MSVRRSPARRGLQVRPRPATVVPLTAGTALMVVAAGYLVSGSAEATPTSVGIRLEGTSGALFPPGDLAPGHPVQACLDVTVDAAAVTANPVHLSVADVTGALAADLVVTVEEGRALSGVTCSATTAATSFTGTLADLARTSATAAGGVSEGAVRPAGTSSARYRITAYLPPTSAAQGAAASARFVWSVSASSVSVAPVPPVPPVTAPVPPVPPVTAPVPPVPSPPVPSPPVPSPPVPSPPATAGPTAGPTENPAAGPSSSARPAPGPSTAAPSRTPVPSTVTPATGTNTASSPTASSPTAPGSAPTRVTSPVSPSARTGHPRGRGAGDQSGGIFARLPGAGAVHALIDALPVTPTVRALLYALTDSGGFPLLLLLLVLLFIAVQNRLDRRDPKLALAPLRRDEDIDFDPDRWLEFDGEFDEDENSPTQDREDARERR